MKGVRTVFRTTQMKQNEARKRRERRIHKHKGAKAQRNRGGSPGKEIGDKIHTKKGLFFRHFACPNR